MTADEIRGKLRGIGGQRMSTRHQLERADRELAELLALAIECPDLTMTDAARCAGVGRSMAYKLVREHAAAE